jgi:hypothetical protein
LGSAVFLIATGLGGLRTLALPKWFAIVTVVLGVQAKDCAPCPCGRPRPGQHGALIRLSAETRRFPRRDQDRATASLGDTKAAASRSP